MLIFERVQKFMYPVRFSFISIIIAVVAISLVTQQNAHSQPIPNAKETLQSEARAFQVSVPDQDELAGGHLQGIQLLNETLIVSGSSSSFAYLALFQKLGEEFRFLGIKKLGKKPFNHAGGFQIAGNWLAIGIEDPVGKRESVIQLIDVSSFKNLSSPPVFTLNRKGESKRSTAGAVALIKRKDHFVLAVGSWDCTTIDFYVSNGLDPHAEGFNFEPWTSWDSREAIRKDWTDRSYGSYQNLQLTEDATGLYITGFCRTPNGTDQADVFLITPLADPYTMLKKVAYYSVQCNGEVTFRNGAGFTFFKNVPSIIAVGHDLFPKLQFQVFPIKQN
ncbi:MAG: hypothetical protein K9J17_09150 [Flavobacteriales bacterium]|nr:hypothetical protein [Flavobacteriales bacterium]